MLSFAKTQIYKKRYQNFISTTTKNIQNRFYKIEQFYEKRKFALIVSGMEFNGRDIVAMLALLLAI